MTKSQNYMEFQSGDGVPVKAWVKDLPLENEARQQLINTSKLPIIKHWIAAMPDVHWGMGATVGSVVPTTKAIIPAAVGVDIGCGMMAAKTSLTASDLPVDLKNLRFAIEKAVPHGRSGNGARSLDVGGWKNLPELVGIRWKELETGFKKICEKHHEVAQANHVNHLGTLGTGNHFIEVCLDEKDHVWVMLHSGSRGVGNRIGMSFISKARDEMLKLDRNLPDRDLAYFEEGSEHFSDYVEAVSWAQRFAMINREVMMTNTLAAMKNLADLPEFTVETNMVNCHHNYISKEVHFGDEVYVTRKGAVRAGKGDMGIIPGSMGARSFIVRGKGNPVSFESCSHGAGRLMSRTKAKKSFSLDDHISATQGVECRKDIGVIDETPGAYKDIDLVMKAQSDLVDIVHTLKQVVCVKG